MSFAKLRRSCNTLHATINAGEKRPRKCCHKFNASKQIDFLFSPEREREREKKKILNGQMFPLCDDSSRLAKRHS